MPLDTIATDGLSLVWVIAIGFVALLIGGAIGYLLKTRNNGDKERIAELEGQLAAKEEEMTDYRAEVVSQFSQTADKFKTLDESYHALHRQLATSAVALCGDQATPLLTQSEAVSAIIEGDATVETDEATDATIIVDEAPVASDLEVADLEITEPTMDADAVEINSQGGTLGEEEEVAAGDVVTEDVVTEATVPELDAIPETEKTSELEGVEVEVTQEVPILTEDVANDHDRDGSKTRT